MVLYVYKTDDCRVFTRKMYALKFMSVKVVGELELSLTSNKLVQRTEEIQTFSLQFRFLTFPTIGAKPLEISERINDPVLFPSLNS